MLPNKTFIIETHLTEDETLDVPRESVGEGFDGRVYRPDFEPQRENIELDGKIIDEGTFRRVALHAQPRRWRAPLVTIAAVLLVLLSAIVLTRGAVINTPWWIPLFVGSLAVIFASWGFTRQRQQRAIHESKMLLRQRVLARESDPVLEHG